MCKFSNWGIISLYTLLYYGLTVQFQTPEPLSKLPYLIQMVITTLQIDSNKQIMALLYRESADLSY